MILGTVWAPSWTLSFYNPSYYLSPGGNPTNLEGGLSVMVLIGIMIALYFYVRTKDITYLQISDRVVITIALAFFIRWEICSTRNHWKPTNATWGFVYKCRLNPRHWLNSMKH